MARVTFKELFGDDFDSKNSLLRQSHHNATRAAEIWLRSEGKLLVPTEVSMVFLGLEDALLPTTELIKMA
jgi:hypothetical protein